MRSRCATVCAMAVRQRLAVGRHGKHVLLRTGGAINYRTVPRVYAPFEARAGTRMSSFLSDWSTTTARSAWSSAALAGRLQSWRSNSTFDNESFWHKTRL